jgi:hypothetical protein
MIRVMVKLSRIRVDTEKELKGVWKSWNGIELLIARANNPKHAAAMQKHLEPVLHIVREEGNNGGMAETVAKKAAAETLLLDWRDLEAEDGSPLEYSSEQALEFFEDEELQDLYGFVQQVAYSAENYRRVVAEDTAGN